MDNAMTIGEPPLFKAPYLNGGCDPVRKAGLDGGSPVGNELADYIGDHYGTCDRGADCYWGKDQRGKRNGCLYVGWRGRECPHWHPVEARTYKELAAITRT